MQQTYWKAVTWYLKREKGKRVPRYVIAFDVAFWFHFCVAMGRLWERLLSFITFRTVFRSAVTYLSNQSRDPNFSEHSFYILNSIFTESFLLPTIYRIALVLFWSCLSSGTYACVTDESLRSPHITNCQDLPKRGIAGIYLTAKCHVVRGHYFEDLERSLWKMKFRLVDECKSHRAKRNPCSRLYG